MIWDVKKKRISFLQKAGHPSLPSPHSALSLGVQGTDKFKQQQLNTRVLTWDPQQSLSSTQAPLSLTMTTAEGLLSFPYFFFLKEDNFFIVTSESYLLNHMKQTYEGDSKKGNEAAEMAE